MHKTIFKNDELRMMIGSVQTDPKLSAPSMARDVLQLPGDIGWGLCGYFSDEMAIIFFCGICSGLLAILVTRRVWDKNAVSISAYRRV